MANDFVESVAAEAGWGPTDLRSRLRLAIGEARQTLRLLAGLDVGQDARILEVGAGLGLTSAYLSTCGHNVVALEPAAVGFNEHAALVESLAVALECPHNVLTIGAEQLNRLEHGEFSLVFSNNVLEHVADLAQVLRALSEVLAADGIMVHSCPNYSVPFEPHFGIPLVPMRPRWTERVLPASIAASDLWRSLNFVRARDVEDIAAILGLTVRFRNGSLAASTERLFSDDEFRARHPALGSIADQLRRFGLVDQLRRVPAQFSTPMDFVMSGFGANADTIENW